MPLAVQSTTEEKIHFVCVPVTSVGNPAQVDGPLRVLDATGNPSPRVVQDAATPLEFDILGADAADGGVVFVVEADADLGPGITLIQDTITYTTMGAQATALGLTASAPVAK